VGEPTDRLVGAERGTRRARQTDEQHGDAVAAELFAAQPGREGKKIEDHGRGGLSMSQLVK
jgi:hypothetical protein